MPKLPLLSRLGVVRHRMRTETALGVAESITQVPSGKWARRHSSAQVKLLALTPTRSVHREQVIDALWPDLTVEEAAPRLHKAAHYVRTALGFRDALVLAADSVRLGV